MATAQGAEGNPFPSVKAAAAPARRLAAAAGSGWRRRPWKRRFRRAPVKVAAGEGPGKGGEPRWVPAVIWFGKMRANRQTVMEKVMDTLISKKRQRARRILKNSIAGCSVTGSFTAAAIIVKENGLTLDSGINGGNQGPSNPVFTLIRGVQLYPQDTVPLDLKVRRCISTIPRKGNCDRTNHITLHI
uniref:Uncharacterized protein n=1 Tax=Oryza brachyantha TaxID=4533 RepID=J3KUZ6_ORYBR